LDDGHENRGDEGEDAFERRERLSHLVGKLALFREPPGLRVIVRVLGVRPAQEGFEEVLLRAVVTARRGRRILFRSGERIVVEGPKGATRNYVWSLHRLDAEDPAAAIEEAQARFGQLGVSFEVGDAAT
jgi:hypothetical protein